MKYKAGDISRWFQQKKASQDDSNNNDKETDEAILNFKEAFENYSEKVKGSTDNNKEKLLSEARNITNKLSLLE